MKTPEVQVNLVSKKVVTQHVTYEEIVHWAYGEQKPETLFTVTWFWGSDGGTLAPGQLVAVKDGMNFTVVVTNKS